jgi:CO/xanthine dehydrogenase Mo-binding subunit
MTDRQNALRVVRQSPPDIDGAAKLSGAARYLGDFVLPGMLYGKILHSPVAHARIRSIDASEALAQPGVVVVVTGADLAGLDPTYGINIRDQPVLAMDKVRYVGDAVAAVAASDEASALDALKRIHVDYEVLPTVATIADALATDAPPLFDATHPASLPKPGPGASARQEPAPNILYEYIYENGDFAQALAACEHVFEDQFSFARVSHYTLEPYVVAAAWHDDSVELWSNNQDPFLLREDVARVFGLPLERVRFHAGLIGGGFGSKSYCKIEPLAALLARKAGRPVRLSHSMDENLSSLCEHGAKITMRTGLSGGRTVLREAVVRLDGGAYADASPTVAARIGDRIGGPYRWEAVRCRVIVARTNTVPAGSFRGFGAVHVTWASESQIDMAAHRLGDDPYELRRRNLIPLGAAYAPGVTPLDSDLHAGLEAVAARIGYAGRTRPRGRGVGFAIGIKSAGAAHRTAATVRLPVSGRAIAACGVTEIGQGARTAMAQIVAEVLAVPLDAITVAAIDTSESPYDAGTHASCGIAVTGLAMQRAAEEARRKVLELGVKILGATPDALVFQDLTIEHCGTAHSLASLMARAGLAPDSEIKGAAEVATGSSFFWLPSWTAAEVEVDVETGLVRVLRLVSAADAGCAINLERCRSQIEGGVVQGFGQALFEELVYDGNGMPLNATPLGYRVSRLGDLPREIEALVLEQGHGPGPFGSKGIGEAGNQAVAAAIANAIEDAVGARVTELPITPARVLAALDRAGAKNEARS